MIFIYVMTSTTARIACIVAAILSFNRLVIASPTPHFSRDVRHSLAPRLEVNYVDCDEAQKSKLETSFADAAALANIAFDMDQSKTPFTHYLRPEDGDSAKSLWSLVAANNDPTNAPYTFSVRCAKADDAECKGGNSLAITDAKPQDGDTTREMKICPLFFTADETKNNLDSKKYDGDKRGSWCQLGQHFKDFETGGHTLLHEMTHLDALAKAAGLPERTQDDFTSHGTDDVVGFGDDYVSSARSLLDTWVNHPGDLDPNALKPFQNAENIAAAATEWWFIKSCQFAFDDITL